MGLGKLGKLLGTHVGMVPNPVSQRTREARSRLRGLGDGQRLPLLRCRLFASGLYQGRAGNRRRGELREPHQWRHAVPQRGATAGLMGSPLRVTTVKYRAPHSDHWEDRTLDWAMGRIAQLVKETRDVTYEARNQQSVPVNRTLGIGHLGGATLDNEENYLIKKLFSAGLGIVAVENQAVFDTPPRCPVWVPGSRGAPLPPSRASRRATASSSWAPTWPRTTPVGFSVRDEGQGAGARVIHVDPRFSRTSALCDVHVPCEPGAISSSRHPRQPRHSAPEVLSGVRCPLHQCLRDHQP